jgi:hypothetical protein
MNDCGAKSKLSALLIYLSKTGNYRCKEGRKTKTASRCNSEAMGLEDQGEGERLLWTKNPIFY